MKPSIPKGTRDFSPSEMVKRECIFDTIKSVFKVYGYQSIETPAMENLSSLLGKYGEEGDKLIFRILNSGYFLADVTDQELLKRDVNRISSKFCEKGLRYDLTVPFARYVVQHREEITFPFRRYQIQPVWRADRPQKGRYREFFQCDVDVIGSDSLLNEYELIRIIDEIFARLRIRIVTKINNRKILSGLAEYIGEESKITDITVAIDKIDKIGLEAVIAELKEKGISGGAVGKLRPVLAIKGSSMAKIEKLEKILSGSETGIKGITEMKTLLSYIEGSKLLGIVELDLTLARGLNYYTGAIIEVKSADVSIGSLCGGGRYDNLTGVFGLEGVSGVGVSFGADRIYDVMTQLSLFNTISSSSADVLILNFGDSEIRYALNIASQLRKFGLKSEIYPDNVKLKKQMSYADSKMIPYVIIAGNDEIKNNEIKVKVMATGEQTKIPLGDLEKSVSDLIKGSYKSQ